MEKHRKGGGGFGWLKIVAKKSAYPSRHGKNSAPEWLIKGDLKRRGQAKKEQKKAQEQARKTQEKAQEKAQEQARKTQERNKELREREIQRLEGKLPN